MVAPSILPLRFLVPLLEELLTQSLGLEMLSHLEALVVTILDPKEFFSFL